MHRDADISVLECRRVVGAAARRADRAPALPQHVHDGELVFGQHLGEGVGVLDELAEPDQSVRGCIIALENDIRLSRALRVTTNIDFYRYKVNFELFKA